MLFSNIFESLSNMDYDPELFGKALPCLIAIGCALPPDYSLPQKSDDDYNKPSSTPDQPQYNPLPINTSAISLDNDLNSIVQKFSEHYHDAWASRKMEAGWSHGENWSDSNKLHPRLKPYNMLNDYVRNLFAICLSIRCMTIFLYLGTRAIQGTSSGEPKGIVGIELEC